MGATPGDAITQSALVIRDLLRRVADSEIFALFLDPLIGDEIRPLRLFDEWCADRNQDALILFHASMGDPLMLSFLLERAEPLILIYHNLSPDTPFLPFDPAVAGKLREGRRELQEIRERVMVSLADSAFNARELLKLGFKDVRVSPLLVDWDDLVSTDPDPNAADELKEGGPLVLFVGQLLPHKRPDLLLQAFNILTTYHRPDARLRLVGPDRLVNYRDAVQRFIDELNIHGARMTGAVSQAALVAHYRQADVFATMSDHEGFCVPLLESMAFELPVVARSMGAIPETAGDAALLLGGGEDPFVAAEALAEVIENASLRSTLIARGKSRFADFAGDTYKKSFIENILSVI